MIPGAEFYTSPARDSADQTSAFSFVIPGSADQKATVTSRLRGKRRFDIMFQSKQMKELVRIATQFAESSASVLVTGESGTGKELFSRLIHEKSGRPLERFVAFNCAAVPEALIESEIFGHERGAFTGAVQKRAGYFERANHGTILLDEISEIPVSLQAKLLRVIEEQEVQPVGSERAIPIDVRIVATSNRDLKKEVAEGRFRADLFHRLNVLELQIPSLRERVADIPLLVLHFIEMFRNESKSGIKNVEKEAMQQLCGYHWPGNVRELRNVIHRACIMSIDGQISPAVLPTFDVSSTADDSLPLAGMPLAEVERKLIIACLQKYGGSKKSAAAELGVTTRTLSNKLKQYRENGTPYQSEAKQIGSTPANLEY